MAAPDPHAVESRVRVRVGVRWKGGVSVSLTSRCGPVALLEHVLPRYQTGLRLLRVGLELGLEEVFGFDSKSENRDRAVEAVE